MKNTILKSFLLSFILIHCLSAEMLWAQAWVVKTPMPTKRALMAAAALDSNIYVFGGVTTVSYNLTDTVEVYSTVTDSWTVCSSMPTARCEMIAETVGGKVYVIGGFNYEDGALDIVEIYDPATDSWSTGMSMPTPRSQMSASVIDEKIYITGGYSGEYTELEIYDPATDSWSTGSPIPTGALQNNGGVNCNGKFHVLGGKDYSGSSFYNTNYEYDPSTDEWSGKALMPEELFAGAAVTLDNKIHYFGGSQSNVPIPNYDYHYIYDPSSDEWTSGLTMLEERANHVAVTVGSAIYVIGGYISCDYCDSTVTNLNEMYTEELVLPSVTLGDDTAFCLGNTLTLSAGNPECSYLWNTGDTTQTILIAETGTYSVTVTNSAGSASDTIMITVNSLPEINLGSDTTIISGSTLTLDAGNPGSSYVWSTGAITQTIDVMAAGTYWVSVTNIDGCSSSDTIRVTIGNVGIEDIASITEKTIVFPNPADEYLLVSISNQQLLNTEIVLKDAYGKTIRNYQIKAKVQPLSLEGLVPGLYILKLTNGETFKILKR